MPFAGQFPIVILESAASGSSVLEVFARNLFSNMDTGEVYLRSGDRSPITRWSAKRGDKIPVQQRFVNEELDGTDELIKLPAGVQIRFEAHRKINGVVDYSQLMVQQNAWTAEDLETDPHYDATVDFDTPAIDAAIGRGTGNELPYIDLECDIEVWKDDDRLSSANFDIRVYNDHSRGEGDVPSTLGFIGNGLTNAWWISGLVGGENTDLDGQATTHLEYGKPLVIVEVGDGPPSLYRYTKDPDPGVTVCDGVNLVKPTDYFYDADPEDPEAYALLENIGLWVLKE